MRWFKPPLLNETFPRFQPRAPPPTPPAESTLKRAELRGERGSLTQGRRERERVGAAALRPASHRYSSLCSSTSLPQRWNPAARPSSGGGSGGGTHVRQPGASRSLAEKETRKRTASCATPELTVANCWLIFILMSDQRLCDPKARGEAPATRRPSPLFSPAARTRLYFPEHNDTERGSALESHNS